MDNALYIALGAAAFALLFAFTRYGSIMKKDAGSEKMQDISKQVQDGAAAFLTAEYKWLAVFVAVVAGRDRVARHLLQDPNLVPGVDHELVARGLAPAGAPAADAAHQTQRVNWRLLLLQRRKGRIGVLVVALDLA